MFEFLKTDKEYLAYAHANNVDNLKKFAPAGVVICLLLLTDRSGPTPGVPYNHIFNSDVTGVTSIVLFALGWIMLKFARQNVVVEKTACWIIVFTAYILAGSISYISVSSDEGLTSVAVAYLMISFLFAERLHFQIAILLANSLFFYVLTVFVGGADPGGIRIALISIVFLSMLVVVTMDKQRKEVFYSQKKIAEQVKELNNALDVKAAFFGHMSHELRTPLNAIIGFSDMLKTMAKTGIDPNKVEEYATFINSGGNHLLSLVNDLLDQNKLETGEVSVSIEPINVGRLVSNYVDELKPISDNKNQQVTVELENDYIEIESDRRIFKQIIYNILSNAQNYTPENGLIEVSARRNGEEKVEINIKDNGQGMPDEVMDQIHNTNISVRSHFISQAKGTGLGLIIVRQLLYRLGGTINATSSIGAGTNILLSFPTKYSN